MELLYGALVSLLVLAGRYFYISWWGLGSAQLLISRVHETADTGIKDNYLLRFRKNVNARSHERMNRCYILHI
jgi:hypothetical protein